MVMTYWKFSTPKVVVKLRGLEQEAEAVAEELQGRHCREVAP
jgi:hypothetical protein